MKAKVTQTPASIPHVPKLVRASAAVAMGSSARLRIIAMALGRRYGGGHEQD